MGLLTHDSSWASLIAQLVKESACNAGDPSLIPGSGRFPWRRDRLPIPVFLGFPCDSASKESACNAGDLGSIPGLGRCPVERNSYPLHLFWPGEFNGLYSPWSHEELDTTERLALSLFTLTHDIKLFFYL